MGQLNLESVFFLNDLKKGVLGKQNSKAPLLMEDTSFNRLGDCNFCLSQI